MCDFQDFYFVFIYLIKYQECKSYDVFECLYICITLPISKGLHITLLLMLSVLCAVHTRWWWRRIVWGKWRGSWGCKSVSLCPLLMGRPRLGVLHITTQPNFPPAACLKPHPSLWVTTTPIMATGTARWTPGRTILSTFRPLAIFEGWVSDDKHEMLCTMARGLELLLYFSTCTSDSTVF